MSRARSMLVRIRKIETSGKNQMLIKIGSFARLEQLISQPPPDVDPRVGLFLLECVRGWVNGSDHNGEPMPKEFCV